MSAIIEFLKVLGPLLRSGKMSYSDALTRFRAQYARPAEGMEKAAIMKEVEQAPSNVVQFPKNRIPDWWKSRPLFKDSPEAIAKIKAENKAAIKRLKDKKKTAEDFIDEGDWDPSGMASGGIPRS